MLQSVFYINTRMKPTHLTPRERIENVIFYVRGQKVMLDQDLAELYGVETKKLNQAVKRNIERFPEDFMFSLNKKEWETLKFHFGTSKDGRGGRRYLPYVFTEHGALMLANVLNSKKAVLVSIEIVRAFARLRQIIASNKLLAQKLAKLEKKYDSQFKTVFDAIRSLMEPASSGKTSIGFKLD